MTEVPRIFVDTTDIVTSIEARRRNPDAKLLPLLLKPKYMGKKKDEITGREYSCYALEELDELGIPYVVLPLDFGDYHIPLPEDEDGKVLVLVIERKTVNDLIRSFIGTEGAGEIRIDEQMEKCLKRSKESYDNAIVVLMIEDFYDYLFYLEKKREGEIDYQGIWKRFKINPGKKLDAQGKPKTIVGVYGKNGMMNPRAILAKIDAIEKMGVVVWKFGGALHAHEELLKIVVENKDKKTKSIKATRRKVSAEDPWKSYVFYLQGLPGIGGGLATRAAEKYPVPVDFVKKVESVADAKELGIQGLGPDRLADLKKFFLEKKEKIEETRTKVV